MAEPLAPPTQADLDAFRGLFWRIAAQLSEATLRAKFLSRWPSEQAFTAWEIKQLFLDYQAAGVDFFRPLKQEPWGARTFIVRDPDGNLLLFAGPAT